MPGELGWTGAWRDGLRRATNPTSYRHPVSVGLQRAAEPGPVPVGALRRRSARTANPRHTEPTAHQTHCPPPASSCSPARQLPRAVLKGSVNSDVFA